MFKINMFKMDSRTFWSQLKTCYVFYIELKYIRNPHTESIIVRNKSVINLDPHINSNMPRLMKSANRFILTYERTDGPTLNIEKLCF